MNRNLALNLARVTEAAAINAAKWLGKGDKNGADGAAVDAMRRMLDQIEVDAEVVIGEGEMDEAPMLYIGEKIGEGKLNADKVDIAVDPVDGTTAVSKGMNNAIAVIAMAPRGCLLFAPDVYMDKIACGPKAKGCINLNDSPTENIKRVAKALDKNVEDITVAILDRERHQKIVDEVRTLGAKIKSFSEGDIITAVETCFEDSGVDLLLGIGGAPEGVIAAAAIKCLGGDFQGRLAPSDEEQIKRCKTLNADLNKIYRIDDLVKGDEVVFSATGISKGELLDAVKFISKDVATTETLVLRLPSGTARYVKSQHKLSQKPEYAK